MKHATVSSAGPRHAGRIDRTWPSRRPRPYRVPKHAAPTVPPRHAAQDALRGWPEPYTLDHPFPQIRDLDEFRRRTR